MDLIIILSLEAAAVKPEYLAANCTGGTSDLIEIAGKKGMPRRRIGGGSR